MTYEEFNTFCGSFPATHHVIQWGNSHVWKVGSSKTNKVFAIGGWEKPGKLNPMGSAVTFKTSDYHFDLLKEEPGYRPAPYLASRGMKWIQHYEITEATLEALKYYIEDSYRIVSLGLTKKLQQELGLNQ